MSDRIAIRITEFYGLTVRQRKLSLFAACRQTGSHPETGSENCRKLTGPYLSRVEMKRSALYQRVREFMEEYEFFVLPVNQVLPFDVTKHYPTEINGVKMENYLSWMKSAWYITATGNPAASVPCAYSKSGLPIGIQIVGRNHDDWGVLQMAFAFEQARNLEKRKPVAVS
jgi:amidase